jgi:hypothetical protein
MRVTLDFVGEKNRNVNAVFPTTDWQSCNYLLNLEIMKGLVSMDHKNIVISLQSSIIGLLIIFSSSPNVEAFDFSGWDGLIKQYVAPKTIDEVPLYAVDYFGVKKDPRFSSLVSSLKVFSSDALKSRESKLTFWINAYNIFAVKMITDNYPVESIKDVGSFFKPVWKRIAGNVGGKKRTLNEIEHKILRKMDEPRIHVAIVCASVSCPDLRPEAYSEKRLNEQLDDQMRKFLQSQKKGMKLEKGKVYLSPIFKWFADDFESRGGVLKFLSKYINEKESQVLKNSKLKISYMNYNWNVNGY